jgi:hypothetical protein
MWDWLSGKKTYIVSALMAASSIFGFTATGGVTAVIPLILDFVTSPEMTTLLQGMGLATIRAGVAKSGPVKK